MSTARRPTFSALLLYAGLNGALALGVAASAQKITQMGAMIKADQAESAAAVPSRVEKFKLAESAAARAPQQPVPRVIVARDVPDMPVQLLAVRIDHAENVKVKPLKTKRKSMVRAAKTQARQRKPVDVALGKLPPFIVQFALTETGNATVKRTKKAPVVAESSRDITNRSLGVLMVMKN